MGIRTGVAAGVLAAFFVGAAGATDWKVETLVPGSAFHGVHGIRLGPDGDLYAGSVLGQSLWAVNRKTGKATGDERLAAEGAGERLEGKVQKGVGALKDAARDVLKK